MSITKKISAFLVGAILFMGVVVPVTVDAGSPLKPNNPFVDDSDSGSAEQVNVIGSSSGQKDAVVNVVRGYINWVLGVMGLIALMFLIYGGFLMVTSAGEEDKYSKGYTILKHAVVGLILIGTAWFVISIIFWLINLTQKQSGAAGSQS